MKTSRPCIQRQHRSSLRGNSQGGIALLVILLIVAIVSILATEMMARLQINVARTVNIKDNNQAYWYAVGAEQFAEKSLNDLKTLSPDNMNLGQPWAQVFEYPINGGGIQAELIDLQSCFNLNTVVLPESLSGVENQNAAAKSPAQGFFNLIRLSTEDIDSFTAETVRDSLKDWLDPDNDISGYGAEDADYESLRFPYVAANALMTNKSELRLVNGIEMDSLRDLLPHVCVIPDPAFNTMEVNINTVTEENAHVIAAMLNLNLDAAKRIIASRPLNGFADTNDFLSEPEIVAKELTAEQKAWFVIKTNYFMLRTKTRYNNATFKMVSIFKLDSEGEGVSVISREFGGIN
ncbi:MAG: general secretion pathway protein K [Glaciecola sp.]|jgi:general secretion pathway protein K